MIPSLSTHETLQSSKLASFSSHHHLLTRSLARPSLSLRVLHLPRDPLSSLSVAQIAISPLVYQKPRYRTLIDFRFDLVVRAVDVVLCTFTHDPCDRYLVPPTLEIDTALSLSLFNSYLRHHVHTPWRLMRRSSTYYSEWKVVRRHGFYPMSSIWCDAYYLSIYLSIVIYRDLS